MKLRLLYSVTLLVFFVPAYGIAGSYSVDFILEQVKQKKLPSYCAHMGVLMQGRTAEGRQLRASYGPGWEHMHHFCWALVDAQKGYDGQAISNIDYALRRVGRNFKLRPMVLKQKAQILMLNGRVSEAVPVYKEIIDVQPDIEDGYLGLANIFLQQGDKKTAREIVKQGLRHSPDSAKLKALTKSSKPTVPE